MPHRRRPARRSSRSTAKGRLKKAEALLERAWDCLKPGDMTPANWGKLRDVMIHLQAQQRR